MSERVIATIENMRKHYTDGVFAYSIATGEEYSADPSDYFWAHPGWKMTDDNGNPMYLATRHTQMIYVDDAA